MSRLTAIFLALSTLGAVAAPPRIAVIRVSNVYEKLPSTRAELSSIEAQRSEILKDRRADDLRKLVEELQALQAQIQKSDPANPNDPDRQKLTRDYEIKRTSLQSLQQDFETFRSERTLEINRKMVAGMRTSLERITSEARTLATKQGYDWLIDSSGNSNTGLPVLLYSKDAKDLTDEVLALLSKEPAGATAESAAPAPPPAPAPETPEAAPATPPAKPSPAPAKPSR